MMQYVKFSCAVLTDSGGLQKEACFLGKKCINIYEHTGWKELEKAGILFVWDDLNSNKLKKELNVKIEKNEFLNEFGNGKASQIIANEIYNHFKKGVSVK